MDIRFLKLRRLVNPTDIEVFKDKGYSIIHVDTDGLDQILINGLNTSYTIEGPRRVKVPVTNVETVAATRSIYEPHRPAQAQIRWQGGFMEGVEQLIFDLLRAMFSAGGLGEYLKTLGQDTDAQEILGHIQVSAAAALRDIINRQAGRRVPPSRQPLLFELVKLDAQGRTLSMSFDLKTKTTNLEFSLWL